MPFIEPICLTVAGRLVQALAVIDWIQTGPTPDLLADLDSHGAWLAALAADALGRLSQPSALIDVERAVYTPTYLHRSVPSIPTAAGQHSRPRHAELIAERAGAFCLPLGVDQQAAALFADAAERYAAWGATAKVNQLVGPLTACGPRLESAGCLSYSR